MKTIRTIASPLVLLLISASISIAACNEKDRTLDNIPSSDLQAEDVKSLLTAIEEERNLQTGEANAKTIEVQIPLGENEDVQNIWVRIDIQNSTESRLLGAIVDVPKSWQIIRPGQPVAITDLKSILAWQKVDANAE